MIAGRRSYWLLCIAFFAVLAYWLWPALHAMHHRWLTSAIEYSYLIVLLSAYLIYVRLTQSKVTIKQGNPAWVLPFLLLVAIIFVSNAVGIVLIPQILVPAIIVISLAISLGENLASKVVLPMAFLYFTIPFWQAFDYVGWSGIPLNETLRVITTVVVSGAIRLTGIPALIEGDFFVLPSGTVEIAEGCSGRAYFLTALELSIFYALAFLRRWRSRFILVGIACALALLGNWIRVFVLILVGYFSEMQNPLVWDHGTFGWIVFCVVTLPFIFAGRWLEIRESSVIEESDRGWSVQGEKRSLYSIGMVIAAVIVVLVAEIRIHHAGEATSPIEWSEQAITLDADPAGTWPDFIAPVFPTAASTLNAWYSGDGFQVGLFAADYPYQTQSREVIHFDNDPVPWKAEANIKWLDASSLRSDTGLRFREYTMADGQTRMLTWVAYRIAGNSPAGTLDAKLLQAKGILSGRQDAQVYVLTTDCADDCSTARERLDHFVSNNESVFRDARAENEPS